MEVRTDMHYTRKQLATNWRLWQSHVDPHGNMTKAEFDALSLIAKYKIMKDAFGPAESSKKRNPSWPSAELLPVIVEFRDAHGSFLSSRKMGRAVASTVKEAKTAYSLWCTSTGHAPELITDVVEKTSSAKGHPYGWVVIVEQGAAARRNPHCNPRPARATVRQKVRRNPTGPEHRMRGSKMWHIALDSENAGDIEGAIRQAFHAERDFLDAGDQLRASDCNRLAYRLLHQNFSERRKKKSLV